MHLIFRYPVEQVGMVMWSKKVKVLWTCIIPGPGSSGY